MKKLFMLLLSLPVFYGCGTWHYEGAVQSPPQTQISTEEPQPTSGYIWKRDRTSEKLPN